MRAAHVGLRVRAFSCLLAVSLAVAMQASGAAADDLLAGPTSVFRSALPSRSPQSWDARYLQTIVLPVLAPSDLPQAENGMLDPTLTSFPSRSRVNQRHLLTFDSRRRVSADTALRAIATKDTLATDPAMAATPTTCEKCQWQ